MGSIRDVDTMLENRPITEIWEPYLAGVVGSLAMGMRVIFLGSACRDTLTGMRCTPLAGVAAGLGVSFGWRHYQLDGVVRALTCIDEIGKFVLVSS